MAGRPSILRCAGLGLLLIGASACGGSDSRARVLEDRARWNVELLGWAEGDDGRITVSARVAGPVRSALDRLTCRVVLLDAAGAVLGREWWTIDLSGIERGVPREVLLRLGAAPGAVDGITLERVLAPTAEEVAHIPELAPGA